MLILLFVALTSITKNCSDEQQASSIGSLKESFIECIYRAAQGAESVQQNRPTNKNGPAPGKEQNLLEDLQDYFRIYFPTRETVAKSKGGVGVCGLFFFLLIL